MNYLEELKIIRAALNYHLSSELLDNKLISNNMIKRAVGEITVVIKHMSHDTTAKLLQTSPAPVQEATKENTGFGVSPSANLLEKTEYANLYHYNPSHNDHLFAFKLAEGNPYRRELKTSNMPAEISIPNLIDLHDYAMVSVRKHLKEGNTEKAEKALKFAHELGEKINKPLNKDQAGYPTEEKDSK